jgi:hypothetical protein
MTDTKGGDAKWPFWSSSFPSFFCPSSTSGPKRGRGVLLFRMKRVNAYVSITVVAALLVAVLLYRIAPNFDSNDLTAVLWLSILGVVTLLQSHKLPRGGGGSIAFIPFLACALVSPSWLTAAAVASATLISELVSRREPLKSAFNVAQSLLAICAGIIIYLQLDGVPLLRFSQGPLAQSTNAIALPFLTLVAVFFTANTVAVSGVIAASSGRRIVDVWRLNTIGTIVYDLLSAPVVFLFALVYVRIGPLGAAGSAALLLGARQLYKTNRQLQQLNQELLQLMVKAIEARDPYTSGHSRRVAHYSRIIARAIGLGSRQVERVATAALLHDVGKIHEIYAPILRKPGKLTPEEWGIMQTHPIKSAELVSTVSDLAHLATAVRHHHENWDGTGYPDGLAGEAIPLESRIIMFADTIDAMTTDRPYRKALGEQDVRVELLRCSGQQFDPAICQKLVASPIFGLLFAPITLPGTLERSPAAPPQEHRIAVGA